MSILQNKLNLANQVKIGLEEWAGQTAHSSRFLEFYLKLLEIQAQAEDMAIVPILYLSEGEMNSRLRGGQILLNASQLNLDSEMVRNTWERMVKLFGEYPEILGRPPQSLGHLTDEDLANVVSAWYETDEVPGEIIGNEIDDAILSALLLQTARPFLTQIAQTLKNKYDQDAWCRNSCPVCGGKPEFAFLEKEFGARYLLCSRCSTEWLYQRFECPYCANIDHKLQSYLTGDNEYHRLYLCDACKCYLKAVDLRKGNPNRLIPLEALITIAMDKQARELGYHPGS